MHNKFVQRMHQSGINKEIKVEKVKSLVHLVY